MITKQAFSDLLKAIHQQSKLDDKHGDILTQLADPEFQSHKVIFTTPLIEAVLLILKNELGVKEERYIGDEISYWVWELEFGKKSEQLQVYREDGSIVPLKTPEQLYDWIIEQKNYINPRKGGKK